MTRNPYGLTPIGVHDKLGALREVLFDFIEPAPELTEDLNSDLFLTSIKNLLFHPFALLAQSLTLEAHPAVTSSVMRLDPATGTFHATVNIDYRRTVPHKNRSVNVHMRVRQHPGGNVKKTCHAAPLRKRARGNKF